MSDNKASDEQIDLVVRTLAKQAKLGVKTITMSRLRDLVKGNLPLKHVPKLSNYIKINIIPALEEMGHCRMEGKKIAIVHHQKGSELYKQVTDVFIYMMRCGDFLKIGISDDPERRIKDMQTGNPIEIKMLDKIKLKSRENAMTLEVGIHEHLKSLGLHVRGEWFERHAKAVNCFNRVKLSVKRGK